MEPRNRGMRSHAAPTDLAALRNKKIGISLVFLPIINKDIVCVSMHLAVFIRAAGDVLNALFVWMSAADAAAGVRESKFP